MLVPGPGIEPMSPALAGGPLTTALPGKSHRPPLCNVATDVSTYVCLFFSCCFVSFFFYFSAFFLSSCGLFEHFLEFHFFFSEFHCDLSILFFSILFSSGSLYVAFLVVAVNITLHIHSCQSLLVLSFYQFEV